MVNTVNIKSYHPSFGKNISTFTKSFDKTRCIGNSASADELLELFKVFKTTQKDIVLSGKQLGKGYKGKVFEIDDKYALKIPVHFIRGANIPVFIEQTFNSLKTYFGGKIAIFGDYSILKNVGEHTPVGIPLTMSNKNSLKECNDYYSNDFLPKFANLPQKAFDNVAKDCCALNALRDDITELDYSFDYMNPNNFVIKGSKILVLDDLVCAPGANNTISDLLKALLLYKEFGTQNERVANNIDNFRKIFKKIVLAGIKNDLPIGYDKSSFVLDKILKELCVVNVDPDSFIRNLEYFKYKYPNKSTLIKSIKKYLESIFLY